MIRLRKLCAEARLRLRLASEAARVSRHTAPPAKQGATVAGHADLGALRRELASLRAKVEQLAAGGV